MRVHLSAALIAALALAAPARALAWDLATEAADARYDTFRLNRLDLHCRSNPIIPTYVCEQMLAAYPEVAGDPDTHAVIPRPIDPADPSAGAITALVLGKAGDTVTFRAADLGIGYNVGFAVKATRVGDGVLRWEGASKPRFCMMQDIPNYGRRVIGVSAIGANLCTKVTQSRTPADSGGTRFYKTIGVVDDAGCDAADADLTAAAGLSGWWSSHKRNFIAVTAWDLAPNERDTAAYEAQLRAEQAAARDAGVVEPTSTFLTIAPDLCDLYPTDAGRIPLTLSFERPSGDLGRIRVSPEVRNPRGTISTEEYVCRESVDPRLPPAPITIQATAFVSRPAVAAANADDELELSLIPATDFRVELATSPSVGVSVSLPAASFPLRPNDRWESRFQITLGAIANQPSYNGDVDVILRSPTLGGELLDRRTIHVVTTTRRCEVPRHRIDRLPPYLVRKTILDRELGRDLFTRIYEDLARAKLAPARPAVVAPIKPR